MAEDCMTRVCALAIATAACVGLPGALVYAIVRTAAARRFGATAALSVVVVFWVTVSAAYYPRVCTDVVRGSPLVRRLRGQQRALLPRSSAAAGRQGGRGGGRTRRRNGSPAPPARERRTAPQSHDETTFEPCAVCLGDVEKGVAATWLPACQHVFHFHQRCIDQWQNLHGHPTCPICWSDAYVAPPPAPPIRGGARVVVVDTPASYERQQNGVSMVPPPLVARGPQEDHHRVMTALPREPPAAARDDAGEASERCAVCLCDVEKEGETATWLPACLHVFHRHCIDQWLHLHGQSTCPICRSDAFAAAGANGGVTLSSFRSVPGLGAARGNFILNGR